MADHDWSVIDMAKGTCVIEDCGRPHYGRGWCKKHYLHWWQYGTPFRLTVEDRFAAMVDKNGPVPECRPELGSCWVATTSLKGDGYARITDARGVRILAHRWTYEQFVGPIPDGLQIDHLCRVRHCVNPDHLEPVTSRENTMRGTNFSAQKARQTHCIRGHEFTPENTRINRAGNRQCRACRQARQPAQS
jgi:hypothetical protein